MNYEHIRLNRDSLQYCASEHFQCLPRSIMIPKKNLSILLTIFINLVHSGLARYYPCQLSDAETYVYYNSTSGNFTRDVIENQNPNISKKCDCFNSDQYCLLTHSENFCSVPRRCERCEPYPNEPVICYHRSSVSNFILYLWNPSLILIFFVSVSFLTTSFGRQARNYVLNKCFPCVNKRIVEGILRREATVRQTLRSHYANRDTRPDGMRQKLKLQLKTKRVRGADLNNDVITCSICMTEFELDEKVGDLPCGHLFHTECLKTWVIWRNTCPLCNNSDVATPQRYLEPASQVVDSFDENEVTDVSVSTVSQGLSSRRIFSRFRR